MNLRVSYEQQIEIMTKYKSSNKTLFNINRELESIKTSLAEKTKDFLDTITNIETKQANGILPPFQR